MEEETKSRLFVAKSIKFYLFQLFLLAFMVACSVGAVVETPLLPASIGVAESAFKNSDEATIPVAATRDLSQASFMGVEFNYPEDIFGYLKHKSLAPPKATMPENAQPERIEFSFSRSRGDYSSQLIVYPVGQYSTLSNEAKSQIANLKSILADRSHLLEQPLPLLPLIDAIETFNSEPDFIDFQNGSGLSFFIQVDHDHDLMTEEILFYTFQGLTDDKNFYVSLFIPLAQETALKAFAEGESNTGKTVNARDLSNIERQWQLPTLNKSVQSLKVEPIKGFPAPTLPAYSLYPGVLVAYDPEVTSSVSHESIPVIVDTPDGSAEYLRDTPDMIRLTFEPKKSADQSSVLTIQPIRDSQSEFYSSIPPWQRQRVIALETLKSESEQGLQKYNTENFGRVFAFQSGFGRRYLSLGTKNGVETYESPEINYLFDGVSLDGRYLVQFRHSVADFGLLHESELLDESEKSVELLASFALFDRMIESLVINSDASVDSSVPENVSACINDAVFLDDITIPDHTRIERGMTFEKTWHLRNNGTCIWTPDYQLIQAGGNPLMWQVSGLPGIVAPGEETNLSVTLHSPSTPGKYHAWWQLADPAGIPFGSFYSVLFEAPRDATEIVGYGVVEGDISYPAGDMPALIVYFLRTDESERYALQTEEGWTRYANELPIGEYYIFARVLGDESDSGGGYTQAVKCGLECEDHTLVKVVIEEGKATFDINIQDWYAPAGTFPLP